MFCCQVLVDKFSINVNDVYFSLGTRFPVLHKIIVRVCFWPRAVTRGKIYIYATKNIRWGFCILQSSHSLWSRQGEMVSTSWVAVVQTVRHSAGWQLYKMYACIIWNFYIKNKSLFFSKSVFYCKQIVHIDKKLNSWKNSQFNI